ncbi:ABA4-like family protein [Vibrio penaeicida]|uniref:ABA4-like family protein n=1 Tax=Vibrio penaeicida TaxID=104609 RepID=UPI0027357987|nr:ABA4-like family protein [Vibrio penaeicida]MDP2571717.1 ABA4-like family protein [Vibrio penaeicida]
MIAHLAFEMGSSLALLGWLCLVVGVIMGSNKFSGWFLLFGGRFIPFLLSILYVSLVVKFWGSAPNGNYASLFGVGLLFESEGNLAAGWMHFLIFDLFIGRWMIDDVKQSKSTKWQLIPCLPLTFLYGPAGLLLYFVFRVLDKHKSPLANALG